MAVAAYKPSGRCATQSLLRGSIHGRDERYADFNDKKPCYISVNYCSIIRESLATCRPKVRGFVVGPAARHGFLVALAVEVLIREQRALFDLEQTKRFIQHTKAKTSVTKKNKTTILWVLYMSWLNSQSIKVFK